MANLKLTDIIDLAKQGYKVSDIKELLALEIPDSKDPGTEDGERKTEETKPPKEEPEEPKKDQTDNADYKKMYEDLKQQQDELAKKLEESQKLNTSKDVSGKDPEEKSDLDLVNELARSFM